MADGDVTKRRSILWGVTMDDALPYLKVRKRQIIFRELVIGFCTGGKDPEATEQGQVSKKKSQAVGEYCNGKDVAECRKMFGDGLSRVCSSCPD